MKLRFRALAAVRFLPSVSCWGGARGLPIGRLLVLGLVQIRRDALFRQRANLLKLAAGEESGRTEAQAMLVRAQEDLPTPPAGTRWFGE